MKVKVWKPNTLPPKVSFPLYSQIKYNGVNAIYRRTNNQLQLFSRGGKLLPKIPHLESSIHILMDRLNSNELNGELYIHGTSLQQITSAVKKPNLLSSQLTFALFDIADSKANYEIRLTVMT
jgi:hypothetical protein